MSHTLDSFAARVRDILKADSGIAGRAKVTELLSEALKDRTFVEAQFDETSPERKVLYEDPELGFCVLAHRYTGVKHGSPHDHGPSWAIYGQADGETLMTDWVPVEPASGERPGRVRQVREYKLTPGVAHLYNEGDLHAPSRTGPTRLIRIEGTNMERVTRRRFDPVQA